MTSEASEDAERKSGSSKQHDSSKKEAKVKGPGYGNYWRILSLGGRLEHVILCIALCSAAASGVALPLMNIVFGNITGDFNSFTVSGSSFPVNTFQSSLSRNALYFVYLFIGKFVLTYIGMFCFRTGGLRISAALRLGYLQALFSQPIKKLDEVSTGTVANTITTSANEIQASISDRLSNLFQSLALVVAAYAIAFKYSWALTLAVSSGIVFVIIVLGASTPVVLKGLQKVTKADEQHATVASETLSSIRTVFALGAERRMNERHSQGVATSHKWNVKLGKWFALHLAPFFFTTYASYALAFWFGLKLYREGHIGSVTNVIVVFFSILLVTTVMGQIATPIMAINKAISASTNFFDMMDSEQIHTEGLKEPEVSAYRDIELRDVTFAYPTRPGVQVLKEFNVQFRRGKTTALVGPSGSGKSTVVALLERWYDLEDDLLSTAVEDVNSKNNSVLNNEKQSSENGYKNSGSIFVGEDSIGNLDLRWWRSKIGLVQQEPFLFNDTIAKNVSYGLIGTEWENTDEKTKLELVKEACVEAFADEFINKLPQGYSTKVGESGIKLSGGQRQRIAIARSIVRKPAILILDEATSAIDVHGEKVVQAALDRASKNRTTIMIAHRLSTVRKADHIVVLRNGQKIEEGTHSELLSDDNGLYSSLVRAQRIEEEEHKSNIIQADTIEADELPTEVVPDLTPTSTYHSIPDTKTDAADTCGKDKTNVHKSNLVTSVWILMREKKSKWAFEAIVLLAAMGCGAAYALQSWFFAQLIQTFQYTGQRLVDAANFWALMFFVLALAVAILYGILVVNSSYFSAHVGTTCRRSYFSSTLKMPISYFDEDENASGSVMSRISSDPKAIQDLLGANSAFPFISIFNIIGCVIISFYFGWKLTLVAFFAIMPVILGASFLRMRYEVQFDANNSKVFASSSQFATEAIGAFRTVSSLGMERVIIERYNELLSDQIKASTRKSSYAMLIYALSDSIELCGMALAFWYGGQLLASREYSVFQFFVVYTAVVQGSQAAGQYLSILPNFASATASANRILELQGRSKNEGKTHGQPKDTEGGSGARVTFTKVTFRYPNTSTPLFTNLNIKIEPGQFVAFVGPSGCGKTTIISMLERFYDPISGTISVDNDEDISTLDPRAYRTNLALVSQEPRLFSGSVKSNLLLGVDDDSQVTESQMIQACRDAEIHDFLTSLPDGYATELGLNTQTALSGGQKQRLCLARALLRRPKLLLLDEATSSLDSQSEKLVQEAIERLAGQRSMTVVAVAHRLATIQKADVIFVVGERDMGGGSRIVELGSHGELMAKRGVYWSMCKAQALDR